MARSQLLAVIRHAGAGSGEPDADLLVRYVVAADHAAFAALVRRYARLVWGQCRNLLSNEADADDAFQATFLALAKSAKTIRGTHRLGPWLHAVAYKVCLNARRSAARRAKRERGTASREGIRPVADAAWDAAAAAVHEEVNRLPESLRVPFVLCHLEGKAPTAAAEQLGLPWGTFSTRLSRAKQRLLDRLAARGVGAAVAVGAIGGGTASAAVIERANALGSNTASVPASVLSLCSGVGVMGVSREKLLAVLVLAAAGTAALFAPGGSNLTVPAARAAPVPKESLEVKTKKLEELWVLLLDKDEAVSSRALLELSARPKADVTTFLKDKMRPLTLTAERATKLITDLGDEKEEVAKAAFDEMSYFDPLLALDVGMIVKAADGNLRMRRLAALLTHHGRKDGMDAFAWCEVKYINLAMAKGGKVGFDVRNDPNKPMGFQTVLDKDGHQGNVIIMCEYSLTDFPRSEWNRLKRAMMILEHIGTPAAVKVLDAMAGGHPDAGPTKDAKDALVRLKR